MKTLKIIAFIAVMSMASCAKGPSTDFPKHLPALTGTVTDHDSNPIEHIKVTLESGKWPVTHETYTSSEGKFRSDIHIEVTDGAPVTINITLEDIDGDDNGGLFQPHTESVLIETKKTAEDKSPSAIEMVFRLSRATDEENSPQS